MDTLHQIMLLCRPGFENECAAEIMDITSTFGFAAYIKAKPDTGFAVLVSAEGQDTTGLISKIEFNQLIFTRQWFASTKKIDSLPEQNRATPLADRARQIADRLDIRFSSIELSYADTNEGKALNRFCKAFLPHLQNALRQDQLLSSKSRYRLHLFFRDSSSAWLGTSLVENSARVPMGIPRLRMPKSAPSRSTLKLDEAINWFFNDEEQESWFRAGMRAVDLGAAPGGWSWQLVERGLLVTAVDNGPMDDALMRTGMVEHLRTDAFTFKPARTIDWLVCDMAERPLHVSRLIARWFTLGYCRAAIFNLKLPMKKRYQSVIECEQLLNQELDSAGIEHRLRIKHLYHDREEVTACLTRSGDHR